MKFVNFIPNARRQASALGFNRANGFNVSTGNFASAIELIQSNSVFLMIQKRIRMETRTLSSSTRTDRSVEPAAHTWSRTARCYSRRPALGVPSGIATSAPTGLFGLSISSQSGESLAPFNATRDDGAGNARRNSRKSEHGEHECDSSARLQARVHSWNSTESAVLGATRAGG